MIPKTTWLIGSSPDCDLVVDQPSVTWFHCRLTVSAESYLLEDLGSTNGTYVNGQRLTAPARVNRADRVTLGLSVPLPWPDQSPPAAPPPPAPPASGPQGKTVIRIGRDPENDVVIDNPEVSSLHARVLVSPGKDRGEVEDLGSTNGTSLNSIENRVTHAEFKRKDTLYFGPVPIPASRFLELSPEKIEPLPELKPVPEPEPEPEPSDGIPWLRFMGTIQTIGRDPSCDLVIEPLVVSGRHARLLRSGSLLVLEDLKSSNGTFVNGRRISEPTPVKPGDLIGLGAHTMRLVDGEAPLVQATGASRAVYATSTTGAGTGSLTPTRLWLLAAFAIQPLLVSLVALVVGGTLAPGEHGPTTESVLVESLFAISVGAVWLGLVGALIVHLARLNLGREGGGSLATELGWTLAIGSVGLIVASGVTIGLISMRVGFSGDGLGQLAITSLAALGGFYLGRVLIALTGRLSVSAMLAVCLLGLMLGLGGPLRPLPALHPALRGLTSILPSRWAFEGLLLLDNGDKDTETDPASTDDSAETLEPGPDIAEPYFPAESERMGITACISALVLIAVGLLLVEAAIATSAPRQRAS